MTNLKMFIGLILVLLLCAWIGSTGIFHIGGNGQPTDDPPIAGCYQGGSCP